MDIFKLSNPTSATLMEQGIFINDIKSIMWIERYRDAGEFKLVVPADSKVRTQLTIGSFITHVNTPEVMVVENHEISDDRSKEAELVITGRSFETILDNRIVGSNKSFPVVGTPVDYALTGDYIFNQAVSLVYNHIDASPLLNDNDAIPYTGVTTTVTSPGISIPRTVKRGSLYTRLLELIDIENYGIKIARPGPWSPFAGTNFIYIIIHKGADNTNSVVFSYDAGEIERADYLWSNKKLKNASFVVTKWTQVFAFHSEVGYQRRVMYVEATDIDDAYTTAPTGGALSSVLTAASQRGIEAYQAQNDISFTKAEASKEATKYIYRKDYNVGDLVTVRGDYNDVSKMRVSEFVEIEDETGETGYPTLTLEES